jgi:hypothetical protein
MKLCSKCNGVGCEDCGFEGVDSEVTFTKKKIIRNKTLKYQEYQAKKEKELNKVDKKNAREEL